MSLELFSSATELNNSVNDKSNVAAAVGNGASGGAPEHLVSGGRSEAEAEARAEAVLAVREAAAARNLVLRRRLTVPLLQLIREVLQQQPAQQPGATASGGGGAPGMARGLKLVFKAIPALCMFDGVCAHEEYTLRALMKQRRQQQQDEQQHGQQAEQRQHRWEELVCASLPPLLRFGLRCPHSVSCAAERLACAVGTTFGCHVWNWLTFLPPPPPSAPQFCCRPWMRGAPLPTTCLRLGTWSTFRRCVLWG